MNHVLLTSDSFNWAQILFCNLQEEIEKYHRTLTNWKTSFYMSWFVVDAFSACSGLLEINWNWSEECPHAHIYCTDMWDDNFIPRVYELCDLFLRPLY